MLKKIFKWTFISIGSLIFLAAIFYAVVYFSTQSRINKTYAVNLQKLTIPTDSASYLAGKHIAENRGCLGCHGKDLASGHVFFNDSTPIGFFKAANITMGKGGTQYKDEDWIKALRHGLNKQNKSVWFMPSHEVAHLSNTEMAQLISFLKQQPAVDKTTPPHYLKPLGRLLTFFNKFPLLPAEMIDHNAKYEENITMSVSAKYGAYLSTSCQGCHSTNFKGAPAHAPNEPNIPDISATGNPGKWSKDQFFTVLHSGKTPDGRQLTDAMPYKSFTYNDVEVESIYLYLHQLK
jgi:cytochrome c553